MEFATPMCQNILCITFPSFVASFDAPNWYTKFHVWGLKILNLELLCNNDRLMEHKFPLEFIFSFHWELVGA